MYLLTTGLGALIWGIYSGYCKLRLSPFISLNFIDLPLRRWTKTSLPPSPSHVYDRLLRRRTLSKSWTTPRHARYTRLGHVLLHHNWRSYRIRYL